MQQSICAEIREVLHRSVERNRCDAMLLSGGIDSSVLASIASKLFDLTGITVTYNDSPDLRYAKLVAERFSIKHMIKDLTLQEVDDAVENVVRIMRSFDPMEVRNTAVIYSSISALRQGGFSSVMTGDGGDELFLGYNYLLKLEGERLEQEIRHLWDVMHFSSARIGAELGIDVRMPYLDPEFMELAKRIPNSLKIKEQDGRRRGKWILRSCFQDDITEEIAWRTKMPLEQGAGTNILTQRFSSGTGDDEFRTKTKLYAERDSVRIRDKEQMRYYEIYRRFFGPPAETECGARCPECQGCMRPDARFCTTCGAFPVSPSIEKKKGV